MELNNIKLAYLGEIKGIEIENNALIDIFKDAEEKPKNPLDGYYSEGLRTKGEYAKVVRPYGQIYYIFVNCFGKEVYKVVPKIKNDHIFKWECVLRYGNFRKHAVVKLGKITFDFLAYEGEEYRVKVTMKYVGKEMLSHDIYGATNGSCLIEMRRMLDNISEASEESIEILDSLDKIKH